VALKRRKKSKKKVETSYKPSRIVKDFGKILDERIKEKEKRAALIEEAIEKLGKDATTSEIFDYIQKYGEKERDNSY